MADGMVFFFNQQPNNGRVHRASSTACLCFVFKLLGFTHVCIGFRGGAIGGTSAQGVPGRRKRPSYICLTKAMLFQYLSKVFCNERCLFMGKMVKIDFVKERGVNSLTSCNRASIHCAQHWG